ncbi:protein NLRC3-like isoform X2 [Engraulis encrasicolus]|uniref:protein NLRC3-like isoform X2 n=1 Tax=Engraulis encrasicolus TaxID=184585 RepID=UPI002FD2202C
MEMNAPPEDSAPPPLAEGGAGCSFAPLLQGTAELTEGKAGGDIAHSPQKQHNKDDAQPQHSQGPLDVKRPDSPVPSCVSMKSDQSIDLPLRFEGQLPPPTPGLLQQKRSGSPVPSCVSMRSDQSMDEPMRFGAGGSPSQNAIQQTRCPSPVLSMNSDQSIDLPLRFEGQLPSPTPGAIQQTRCPSPGLSMKSDQSIDLPLRFEGQLPSPTPGAIQQTRCPSPGLSMKSDQSIDLPLRFEGQLPSPTPGAIQQTRCPSPALSMKSDQSIDLPLRFEGQLPSPTPGSLWKTNLSTSSAEGTVTSPCSSLVPPAEGDVIRERSMCSSEEIQSNFKSYLSTKLQHVSEGSSTMTLLSDVYTELYITEGDAEEVNDQHEVREVETAREASSLEEDTAIKCSDIFKPLAGKAQAIRTVLTKGIAGIGKTVCVQKFSLDWAEGRANQDIRYIFPLSFRELNLVRDEELCLADLLKRLIGDIGNEALLDSCSSSHDTLFILDGLDECRLPLAFQTNKILSSPAEEASVDVLLTNLIKGHLVPSGLIWITSRPAAAGQVPQSCVDRVTVVRGFGDLQKEDYFRKRVCNEALASKVIDHVRSLRTLWIMCHIPVFCWISAIVLKTLLEESESQTIPKNLTQMYTHFVVMQLRLQEKYGHATRQGKHTVLQLGRLAFQQLEKGNLIFYEEDLEECGIDVTEASVYSGVCTEIFKEESGLYHGKVYCFVHLTIQEFLAALYVLLHFHSGDHEPHQSLAFSELFTASTLSDLQKIAVDKALQRPNGNLDLFLRFLLGLSDSLLQPLQSPLQSLLPHIKVTSTSSAGVIKYIKTRIMISPTTEQSINLFHCLNELNDHSLVEQIQEYQRSRRLYKQSLSPQLWCALVFVLLTSEGSLEVFDLGKYCSPASDKSLIRMRPVLRESTKAELASCNLTEQSCEVLGSLIGSPACRLRELDISDNKIQDEGVKLLSGGIQKSSCKLHILRVSTCGITTSGCAHLMSALNHNPSHLTELDLSNNHPGHSNIVLLSEILKKPSCRIHKLKLVNCNIEDFSCPSLAEALQGKSSSLRTLELSQNRIRNPGVKALCSGLKDTNCRLESLRLSDCGLTESSCKALAAALVANPCHLRELWVSYNKHGTLGTCALTAVKLDPQTALEKLKL